jgi:hypothetical protein
MKKNKVVTIFVLALFALSIFAIPGIPSVLAQPDLSIDDIQYVTESDLVCTNFNATVTVTGVSDMKGVGIKLLYNASLIHGVRVYATGITSSATSWLPVNGSGVFNPDLPPTINNSYSGDQGRVWFSLWGFTPFTGSGAVMIIEFHIELAPPYGTVVVPENKTVSCALDLYDTEVLDSAADPITHTVTDGSYTYIRPQKVVGTPTAVCSVTPATQYTGNDVTFDSAGSDDGGAPPATYAWDVGSDGSVDATGATVVWPCSTPGHYNVTLNVTNNLGLWDTAFCEWDCIEMLGPIIDIYTSTNRWCGVDTDPDKVGVGAGMPADALSPDVNVSIFAEVTYNGAPVNHVLVAFEVRWMWAIDWCAYVPDNTTWELIDECVLFRTAETNKYGIAQIWFRVPTPCDGQMFGKWKAWGKAKVQEVPIEDTMEFDVGYLVTMCELIVDPGPYIKAWETPGDCLNATITYKSISWIPRPVKFFIVIYDECDVPLGQMWVDVVTEPAYYCSPTSGMVEIGCIPIPQWAYVGLGKVYASAFTDFPHECGQAYSPELSAGIAIDWIGY